MGIAIIIVWGESCCSKEAEYLSKKVETDQATDILNVLLNTIPRIQVSTWSYHYEERTRTVTYTDDEGNEKERT